METNKRAVNLATLIICLGSQNFKDSLPGTALTPALDECEPLESHQSFRARIYGFAPKECCVAQTIKSLFTGRLDFSRNKKLIIIVI